MSDEIDRLQDSQEDLLVQVTRVSTKIDMLCQKLDAMIEQGTPRCATRREEIKHLQRNQNNIFGWLAGVTMTALGAMLAHFFKAN